jgi:hypothetical protein
MRLKNLQNIGKKKNRRDNVYLRSSESKRKKRRDYLSCDNPKFR